MINLIVQEYDVDDYGGKKNLEEIGLETDHSTGFGFCIIKDYGREIRVAVKIKNTATIEDFKKLWKILAMALTDPMNPKFKPAIGHERLCNNEIILEDFEFEKVIENEPE